MNVFYITFLFDLIEQTANRFNCKNYPKFKGFPIDTLKSKMYQELMEELALDYDPSLIAGEPNCDMHYSSLWKIFIDLHLVKKDVDGIKILNKPFSLSKLKKINLSYKF